MGYLKTVRIFALAALVLSGTATFSNAQQGTSAAQQKFVSELDNANFIECHAAVVTSLAAAIKIGQNVENISQYSSVYSSIKNIKISSRLIEVSQYEAYFKMGMASIPPGSVLPQGKQAAWYNKCFEIAVSFANLR